MKMKKNTADTPLSTELLCIIDAHWRAASYLSVRQTYLYGNPLRKRPLRAVRVS